MTTVQSLRVHERPYDTTMVFDHGMNHDHGMPMTTPRHDHERPWYGHGMPMTAPWHTMAELWDNPWFSMV